GDRRHEQIGTAPSHDCEFSSKVVATDLNDTNGPTCTLDPPYVARRSETPRRRRIHLRRMKKRGAAMPTASSQLHVLHPHRGQSGRHEQRVEVKGLSPSRVHKGGKTSFATVAVLTAICGRNREYARKPAG